MTVFGNGNKDISIKSFCFVLFCIFVFIRSPLKVCRMQWLTALVLNVYIIPFLCVEVYQF